MGHPPLQPPAMLWCSWQYPSQVSATSSLKQDNTHCLGGHTGMGGAGYANVLAPYKGRGGTPPQASGISYRFRRAHLCLLTTSFQEPLPCASCSSDSMPLRAPAAPCWHHLCDTSIRVSLQAHQALCQLRSHDTVSYLLHTLSCKLLGARHFPTWSHLCPQSLQCLIKRFSERKSYMREMVSGPSWGSVAKEHSLDLQGPTCPSLHISLPPSAKPLLPALNPTGHST